MCPTAELLVFLLLSVLTRAAPSGKSLSFSYGTYGPFFQGYNVSPAAVFAPSSNHHTFWITRMTGPQGDASAVLKIFHDASFPSICVRGTLHDHISLLSKTLSVLLLQNGDDRDLENLEGELHRLLFNPERPNLFRAAFGPHRVHNLRRLVMKLDVTKRDLADQMWTNHQADAKLPVLEEALAERTLLLLAIGLTERLAARDVFLSGFLRFHHVHFVKNRRLVKVSLTPDVALLLGKLAAAACKHQRKAHWLVLADYLGRKSQTVGRWDLLPAVAFEMEAMGQKECLQRRILEKNVEFSRQRAFPEVFHGEERVHLRHSPMAIFGRYVARADGQQFFLKTDTTVGSTEEENEDLHLRMRLTDGKTLSVTVRNSQFLVVRMRREKNNDDPESSPSHSSTSSTSNYWDVLENEESFTAPSHPDDFSVHSDSEDDAYSDSEDKRDHVGGKAKRHFIHISTIVLSHKEGYKLAVADGDVVLAIQRTTATDSLTTAEKRAIGWAWYGSGRETLLQLAATLPTRSLYHLVLVERWK